MSKITRPELEWDLAYGAAIGDALGVPFENRRRGSFRCTDMVGYGTYDQPAGTWSDDAALLLATLDSLNRCGRVDVADMRQRFEGWLRMGDYAVDGYVFDVGWTTRDALESGHGMDDERSNGNGSLMRILPLALTDATDDEIREVSAITHAHRVSKEACVKLVHFARTLIDGKPEWPDLPEEESDVRSRAFVLDTLTASIWCLKNTKDYEQCVLKAVNLGGDSDTTACVAGGLAALRYGYEDIPAGWIDRLRDKFIIDACMP